MHAIGKTALPVVGLCLLTANVFAADGVLIVEKRTTGGKTQSSQIQIEKTRMRAETGGGQIVVFDAAAQVIRMIDPDKKTYMEMAKADVERLGNQMADMTAQMQERMKSLPPEQRAQMEAAMRGRGIGMGAAASAPVKTEYRKTGTDKVGKWTCDKYEGYQKDQKVSDICTVDPSVLGVTLADFDIAKEAARFFQQLVPQNGGQMFAVGGADAGFSGIPVRTTVSIGPQQTTIEVTDVTRKAFSDDSYAVPAGFQKQGFPGGGRRGRPQ